jgi:hypothetical protein
MWNGVENNDLRENLAWALSFGFPITRQLGAKVIYLSTRSQESIGQDTDSIGAAFSIFWWHRRDNSEKIDSTKRLRGRRGSSRFTTDAAFSLSIPNKPR